VDRYGLSTWGDRYAHRYAQLTEAMEIETEPAVEVLAELARGGRALELGIGDGRLALPLAARGIEVHGIDASEAMVQLLRDKPGGDAIAVTIGNFADVGVEGRFDLVFVAFYTFFALLTEDEQIACFRNSAERLADGGVFLVEAYVPPAMKDEWERDWRLLGLETDQVMVTFLQHDAKTQVIDAIDLWITEEGIRLFPSRSRVVSTSELDLMARLAGLRLRDRWGGWGREPFRQIPGYRHISVYERA
jgi:SAM-dependent methyltransferase